jgi:hypothetical protein
LRKQGLSRKEASTRIEAVFDASFRRIILSEIDDRRRTYPRPECWFLLAEGLPVERIFPDLEQLGLAGAGAPN